MDLKSPERTTEVSRTSITLQRECDGQAAIHPPPIVEFRARIRLRSQLQLGVAQLAMKITTSGPARIEGIVVAILLARLGRHLKDFRTPEVNLGPP